MRKASPVGARKFMVQLSRTHGSGADRVCARVFQRWFAHQASLMNLDQAGVDMMRQLFQRGLDFRASAAILITHEDPTELRAAFQQRDSLRITTDRGYASNSGAFQQLFQGLTLERFFMVDQGTHATADHTYFQASGVLFIRPPLHYYPARMVRGGALRENSGEF